MTVSPAPSVPEQRAALLGVIVTVIIWGGNVVLLKALLGHLNAETINVGRFLIAGTLLVTLAVRAHGWPSWTRRTWLTVAGVGLVGNSLFQALFLTGIHLSPAGVSGVVNGLVPVLVLPLGLLLGVKVTRRQAGGVTLAFAGLLTLLLLTRQPGAPVSLAGLGWLLLAATAWAVYTLFNRMLSARVGALPFVAFSLALGCVPYLLLAAPHVHLRGTPPLALLGVAVSGLGANVIAYLAWARGTQVLGAARTSVWNTLAPVIALLLGAATLHERLPLSVWMAAGVILVGAALANWPARTERSNTPAT
ncbi:DMT family transporter [Deinococcus taeanensis]|uniref:DMT family transporter n=1 Tax=Deinococcus taeanensis TaxID=2737050 RepID=UPI001CDC218A|nr:DMT family transporter [Deinococcus taeanensis]UBV41738.1 DMT family transporter [Deinococcus taeanensis]